ncbi:hypothetical protein Tco_0357177 [Tanacetum coccineum]
MMVSTAAAWSNNLDGTQVLVDRFIATKFQQQGDLKQSNKKKKSQAYAKGLLWNQQVSDIEVFMMIMMVSTAAAWSNNLDGTQVLVDRFIATKFQQQGDLKQSNNKKKEQQIAKCCQWRLMLLHGYKYGFDVNAASRLVVLLALNVVTTAIGFVLRNNNLDGTQVLVDRFIATKFQQQGDLKQSNNKKKEQQIAKVFLNIRVLDVNDASRLLVLLALNAVTTARAEYGVSTSIGYGVSNFLSNTAYSFKLINMAYPLPLDTAYPSSGTETEILEFQSSRRHFKSLSLDELRSLDFNLFSDQEYSEEEAEAMAETTEQYMSKTRTDYGSGVARPKIEGKDSFELKGQFLKELRENTFSGSDNEDANEHNEKVLDVVDLFHVPNITKDQLMLRVFPISLTGAASRWLRNEPTGSIKTWEDLKTKLDVPTRHIFDSRGAVPTKTAADAKKAIQEMAKYSQKWHNRTSRGRSTKTSDGLAAIQAQLNNLGREIKKVNEKVYAAQVGYEQCKGPYYTKDCPLKEEGKTLEEAYYTQFCKPFQGGDIVQQLQDIINGITQILRTKNEEIRASTNASIRNHKALIKTLEIQIGQMSKVLHERGFGSLPSSTEMNLRDQVKSVLTTVEADSHPIRRIRSPQYAISSGQYCTLISLDPLNGDYIELNDINEPFELKRNQGDDLMPTNEEGFEFTHINFFSLLYVNVMSKKFHSSIIKDKMVYKGDNVVGALMNVPIFVGTFSVVTDFAVLEDMDAYRDEGMDMLLMSEADLG